MCISTFGCSVTKISRFFSSWYQGMLASTLTTLTGQILVPPRVLQPFPGLINFLATVVDLGSLHMHPVQYWLASHWDHSLASINLPLTVTPNLLEAIGVWADTEWILQRVPLFSLQMALYLWTVLWRSGGGGSP